MKDIEMHKSLDHMKIFTGNANPELAKEGKNPFILDSKELDYDKFEDFLKSETRYASLAKAHPDTAEALYAQTKELSQARYARYKEMAGK